MPRASLLPNSAIASFVCSSRSRKRDDVAVGLDRVEDAVGARVGLDQAVRAQALVDPERVQRRGVEAGQEHVDDDHQVDLAVLQPQREVLVVVLELVGRGVEARAEHGVVVLDRALQEVARARVEAVGLELFLVEAVRRRRPRWPRSE